ncbi:MAG: hypothetical protein G01um1014106_568 [Parcubacteria group bacterium Gr01-1014_106]|nr:MAG: hypothetical protein G01um1014106_568 [Parcubacteria group bacterium Gr01-1014_106]
MKFSILVPALLVALFWGCYGPALAQSRTAFGSPFKPYVAVGVAYLVLAIVGGLIGMWVKGDSFHFTGKGGVWGFVAGSLGALGALALTWAMFEGGNRIPHVVMAIVFGGAVTVSALYGVWQTRHESLGSTWLWVGIVGIFACAILVAYHTPHETPPARPPAPPTTSAS